MPKYEIRFFKSSGKFRIYKDGRPIGKFYGTEEAAIAEMNRLKTKERDNSNAPEIKPPTQNRGGRKH